MFHDENAFCYSYQNSNSFNFTLSLKVIGIFIIQYIIQLDNDNIFCNIIYYAKTIYNYLQCVTYVCMGSVLLHYIFLRNNI